MMPPAGAPLAARILAASIPHVSAEAKAAVDAGNVNARVVRSSLAEVAVSEPLGVVLSRREARDAAHWLAAHAERIDVEAVSA